MHEAYDAGGGPRTLSRTTRDAREALTMDPEHERGAGSRHLRESRSELEVLELVNDESVATRGRSSRPTGA